MAIYHLSIKIITRGKGKSAVAAAAYRAADMIYSEYDGTVNDYTRKGGVIHKEIMLPENAPPEYKDRAVLWNSVEMSERYKTAQLAREIEVAIPIELSRLEGKSLVRRFVKEQFVDAGMCADVCIHDNEDVICSKGSLKKALLSHQGSRPSVAIRAKAAKRLA